MTPTHHDTQDIQDIHTHQAIGQAKRALRLLHATGPILAALGKLSQTIQRYAISRDDMETAGGRFFEQTPEQGQGEPGDTLRVAFGFVDGLEM